MGWAEDQACHIVLLLLSSRVVLHVVSRVAALAHLQVLLSGLYVFESLTTWTGVGLLLSGLWFFWMGWAEDHACHIVLLLLSGP